VGFGLGWQFPEGILTKTMTEKSSSDSRNNFIHEKDGFIYAQTEVFLSNTDPQVYVNVSSQCSGEVYQAFAHAMHDYVQAHANANTTDAGWGHSTTVNLPRNAKVLVVGGGYTRQVLHSLLGQQPTRVTEIMTLEPKYARVFALESQQVYVWDVTGTYIWYSPYWKQYLERQMRYPLHRFDAIIIGEVDAHCRGTGGAYGRLAHRLEGAAPTLDCVNYSAPTILDWLEAVPSHIPVIYVSSFTPNHDQDVQTQQDIVAYNSQRQSNVTATTTSANDFADDDNTPIGMSLPRVMYVNARQHIDSLGLECIVEEQSCQHNKTRGSRCVGPNGGWPDVTAWDVLLNLHRYWEHMSHRNSSDTTQFFQFTSLDELYSPSHNPMEPNIPRMCRKPQIHVPHLSSEELLSINIQYQCAGPRYFSFGEALRDYVVSWSSNRETSFVSPRTLLPANRQILIWGNSHTRQLGRSLVCQYADQLINVELLPTEVARVREQVTGPEIYKFANGAQLVLVANSYTPYSHDWQRLLRQELQGRSLDDFDTIVMGLFNECGGNNTFSTDLEMLSAILPEVDCLHIQPPSIKSMVQATRRPLIFVSMFDTSRLAEGRSIIQQIKDLADQGHAVNYIDARHIVESVTPMTCLSSKRFSVTDCRLESDPLAEGVILHACTGAQGGVADVVGWRVLHHVWDALGKQ
jgi:hypothetical protein